MLYQTKIGNLQKPAKQGIYHTFGKGGMIMLCKGWSAWTWASHLFYYNPELPAI